MRLFALLPADDGCAHYRIRQPFWELGRRADVEAHTTMSAVFDDRFDEWDIIVGQRANKPQYSAWLASRARHQPTVFEIDDLLWRLDPESPYYEEFTNERSHRGMLQNLTNAHLITCSTEPLADGITQFSGRPATVLPNMVPRRLLNRPLHDHRHDGKVVLGYPASQSHATDAAQMVDGLRKAMGKLAKYVEFQAIGWDGIDERTGVDHYRVERTLVPGRDGVDAYYQLLDFDILLAPLKATPFNDAKSEIKVLECAARGIPAIASDFGPYRRHIKDGDDGMLVSRSKWFDAIRTLVFDVDLREGMGLAARARAEERCYDVNAGLWYDAYASIL